MNSLPELLMQVDPAWYTAMAIVAGFLWFAALRRVLRDVRRISPIRPEQALCGLPKEPMRPSPLARQMEQTRPVCRGVPNARTA
jgi:HAMP domain-containing protein